MQVRWKRALPGALLVPGCRLPGLLPGILCFPSQYTWLLVLKGIEDLDKDLHTTMSLDSSWVL